MALLACVATLSPADGADPVTELPPLTLPPPREIPAVAPALAVPLPPAVVHFSRGEVVRGNVTPVQAPPVPAKLKPNQVPVNLDAVLRMAHDQNSLVRLAHERLYDAQTEQELAARRWLPEMSMGMGGWRHDGGIQDFNGNLVRSHYGSMLMGMDMSGKWDLRDYIFARLEAERKVWQQQGEVARFTADQVLDAASTYVDLMAAQVAEGIAAEIEAKLRRLLTQAKNLEKVDPGMRVEVTRVEAELGAQQMLTRRLHEGRNAAAAKLVYQLGLDAATELIVADKNLAALRLVDHEQPTDTLVQAALQRGPGVQETEAILGVLDTLRAKSLSPLHYLPSLEMRMGEGAFGAAPGSHNMDWDNRWDLGLQARWNLTELMTGRQRKRLVDSKIQQANLSYQDMRGRLTLGVQEAREAAISNLDQIRLAQQQIQHAEESYNLSDLRLRENVKGRSPSEVLLAIRSLVGARLGYLHAIRDYDKAQLRLFILTGAVAPPPAAR